MSLTILHTEASIGWGGQEIRILTEAEGMTCRGHRVLIAAPPEAGLAVRARERGIEAVPLPMAGTRMLHTIWRLVRLIDSEGVQVVNTHSSRDSWLASVAVLGSRPRPLLIRTRHLSTPIRRSAMTRLLYNGLPDVVVTTGEAIRRTMIEGHGFDARKIVSIPTGVDTSIFSPRGDGLAFRRALGVPADAPLIGIVAVLRSWKGHEDFVDAAREVLGSVPDARFVIVGDGPRVQAIRDHIASRGVADRVLMAGHREDVPAALSAFNVFVLSSFGHEGVPQSVLQAMAMEVPIVATDVGAVSEVVRDSVTGVLAQPRNPASLAAGIVRLLRDDHLRRSVVTAARALVEKDYAIGVMLDRLEDLYRERLALKSRPARRAVGTA